MFFWNDFAAGALILNYKPLFFIALGVILLLSIVIGIQTARLNNKKRDWKAEGFETEIAQRNRLIAKQKQQIELLEIKLRQKE